MRVAIFGGSFNPPHVCHLLAVTWVLATRPVDAVWVMPVGAHAFGKRLAPFDHRAAMCRLTFAPLAQRVQVTDIEQRLGGPNRTIDTLQALQRLHPEHRFSLIVGADILTEAHAWKAWDVLERDYGFHILGREGYPPPPGRPEAAVSLPSVSSTFIRDALASGDLPALAGQLAADVLDYIHTHNLYRGEP